MFLYIQVLRIIFLSNDFTLSILHIFLYISVIPALFIEGGQNSSLIGWAWSDLTLSKRQKTGPGRVTTRTVIDIKYSEMQMDYH